MWVLGAPYESFHKALLHSTSENFSSSLHNVVFLLHLDIQTVSPAKCSDLFDQLFHLMTLALDYCRSSSTPPPGDELHLQVLFLFCGCCLDGFNCLSFISYSPADLYIYLLHSNPFSFVHFIYIYCCCFLLFKLLL